MPPPLSDAIILKTPGLLCDQLHNCAFTILSDEGGQVEGVAKGGWGEVEQAEAPLRGAGCTSGQCRPNNLPINTCCSASVQQHQHLHFPLGAYHFYASGRGSPNLQPVFEKQNNNKVLKELI